MLEKQYKLTTYFNHFLMKKTLPTLLLLCILAQSLLANNTQPPTQQAPPLCLMENRGQVLDHNGKPRTDVLFTGRSNGVKIAIFVDGISYQFEKHPKQAQPADPINLSSREHLEPRQPTETYRLDVRLKGANPNPMVQGELPDQYIENYYNIPNAPEGILGVRAFERVVLREVYPGIDWVFYTQDQQLKYDFVVHPGANPALIRLEYSGAESIEQQSDGSLLVKTPLGELQEAAPVSYSGTKAVGSAYRLSENVLSFNLGEYDHALELRIDPALVWGTYYGGNGTEFGYTTTTDGSGNVYLTGQTSSTNAISAGGHQNNYGGGIYDVFLVKFNSNGVRLWATYYGGSDDDRSFGSISTDGFGNVYLPGFTSSTTGIASNGHQNNSGGGNDAFLVKFNNNGVRLWATYYGGADSELGSSTVVDGSGNVYLAGQTFSTNNIASGGHQNTFGGYGGLFCVLGDAFLVKFNSNGVRLWGTYYGGTSGEFSSSVAVDGVGNVYLGGHTWSTNGIAANGHQNTYAGGATVCCCPGGDAFLVKFNSNGVRLWGTYYGGSDQDGYSSTSIKVDGFSNVYMSGITSSTNGIAANGHQNFLGGGATDGFLVKFNSSGIRLWATYYGGQFDDDVTSVTIDGDQNVYISGLTYSANAIADNGLQNAYSGGGDAFLVKFNSNGAREWGTYFGGTEYDNGWSATIDVSGDIYLAGYTSSVSGISANGHQNSNGGGGYDAFLVKISLSIAPVADFTADQNFIPAGQSIQFVDLSSNNPDSWNWSFPGGLPSSSSDMNPYVTYYYPGTYDVVLTSSNSAGIDAEIKVGYITVYDLIPFADFYADATVVSTNQSVQFFDASANSPTSWTWSFPGGTPNTASVVNPIITYSNVGTYNVSLVVSNNAGNDVETKTGYITVTAGPQAPIADFVADETNIAIGGVVSFTNLSQNNPDSWTWSFPGGIPNTSTLANPIVIYPNQGMYNVTLVATNGLGSDAETKTGYIKVGMVGTNEPQEGPVLSISPNPVLRGEALQLNLQLDQSEEISVFVLSAQGMLMEQSELKQLKQGKNILTLNTDKLPAGAYLVVMQNTSKSVVQYRKFVVLEK